MPTAAQASFLQAMVRERVVAEDWLVSIDGNRYSVPFGLIGKTVQVVREGDRWVIRHRGQVVAEHAVLAGRCAAERAARARPRRGRTQRPPALRRTRRAAPVHAATRRREVEVRDLGVYEQLLSAELLEAA